MTPKKLVFVDDDPDDREMIKEGLTSLNMNDFLVLESENALFAYLFQLKPTEIPKAVVLDINMPGFGGQYILKKLKSEEAYQRIPVYIFTCASTPILKVQCINEGAAGYYDKPDTFDELNKILEKICITIQQ